MVSKTLSLIRNNYTNKESEMNISVSSTIEIVLGFINIGVAIKHRNSYWSILNWAVAGFLIALGILMITGIL